MISLAAKKDYYATLGINKNATDDEIKKAYKKLAKENHPDLIDQSLSEDAKKKERARREEKMKEINVAYDVLKDPEKRAAYDQFGDENIGNGGRGGGWGGGGFGGRPEDIFGNMGGGGMFDDILRNFFGGQAGGRGQRQQPQPGPARGADLRYDLGIDFEEAAFGKQMQIKVPRMENCPDCGGTGAEKGSGLEICPECHGMGQKQTVRRMGFMQMQTLETCTRCHGSGKIPKKVCSHCHGEGKIKVTREMMLNIPRGVDNGTRLRIAGGGQAGERGGQPGDLFVYINIRPHQIFKRQGNDVYCEVPISFVQAALGAEIETPTVDGKIQLKVPAGTQSGSVLKVPGKGIPFMRGEGRGDELVTIKVLTPRNLTERQKNLLRQFEEGVDDQTVHPEKKSFLDKLKSFFS